MQQTYGKKIAAVSRHGSHIDICITEVIIVLSDIFCIVITKVIRILDGFALAETFILGNLAIAKAVDLDYIVIIEAFRLLFPELCGSFQKSVHKGVRSQHLISCKLKTTSAASL